MRLFSNSITAALVLLVGSGLWFQARAQDGISLFTGSVKGTYFQFGQNIAGIAEPAGVKLFVRQSKGSVDNVRQLHKGEGALGIVQSDVLGFMSRSDEPEMQRFSRRLRFVFWPRRSIPAGWKSAPPCRARWPNATWHRCSS